MSILTENRTISMILTVPKTEEFESLLTNSTDDDSSISYSKYSLPPSIPIYHGSIIRIEKNLDQGNTFDILVRVQNFHHLSVPSVQISTLPMIDDKKPSRENSIKRRAPICPIFHNSISINRNFTSHLNSPRFVYPRRLAIGLRNLSRIFTINMKSKQISNMKSIKVVPLRPDVEVWPENVQVKTFQKPSIKTQSNSLSKLSVPKILCIKRKYFKIKQKQISSSLDSNDTQIEQQYESQQISSNTVDNASTQLVEQSSTVPHYSKLSDFSSNPQTNLVENDGEQVFVVHPNGDTYSECYEITYELDPNFKVDCEHEDESNRSCSIEFISNPCQSQGLTPTTIQLNNYEQIKETTDLDSMKIQPNNYDATEKKDDSFLYDDEQIVYPLITEDYQVIIEFLKRTLQIDNINSNEFQ